MIKHIERPVYLIVFITITFCILCLSCTATPSDITPTVKGMKFIGINQQGYKEYNHIQTGMAFVLIPGGIFQMGNTNGDGDERPVHEVKIDSFLIGKYEVTQGVWKTIMKNNPSGFNKGNEYPVEMVSWEDSIIFCRKTGLKLPTEAEWEYACRAGTTTLFYWGDDEDEKFLWYKKNSMETTQPVGKKKPNGFGLYDMIGNVWEWCYDWYGEDYYQYLTNYFDMPVKNPIGPLTGSYHVVRGGGWFNEIKNCRSTDRDNPGPDGYCNGNGFRCSINLD